MKVFLVGGAVRDMMMGKAPKDFDFTVVLEDHDLTFSAGPFETMVANLELQGFRIFLKTPEHLTVRAQFPVGSGGFLDGMPNIVGGEVKPGRKRLTADFVLARREGGYSDGRRPDFVEPGTLMDDLKRRDFTMNAIAMNAEGNMVDPFNGRADILQGRIRAVGDAKERMMEDSLRVLRALRFKIQLGFVLDESVEDMLFDNEVLGALINVSDERKMDELNKMFKSNTLATIRELNHYHRLGSIVLSGKVKLMAHMKEKF